MVNIAQDSMLVGTVLGRNRSITTTTDISVVEIESIATQNKYQLESVWVVNDQ